MNKTYLLPLVLPLILFFLFMSCGSSGGGSSALGGSSEFVNSSWVDSSGNLYIADSSNAVIRKVVASTGIISTIAGSFGSSGSAGDGGQASSATFDYATNIALDSSGNIYVVDTGNSKIREINAATREITTVAGTGTAGSSSSSDHLAIHAELYTPNALAIDSGGNLYIADANNDAIRKVTVSTGEITTVAGIVGTSGTASSGSSLSATAATLHFPSGVAVDSSGNIYIADTVNNVIREVNAATGLIETIAGTGTSGSSSSNDGLAIHADLNDPYSVVVDSSGNVLINDAGNAAIRKVIVSTGAIETVAGIIGSYGSSSSSDGLAIHAELDDPGSMSLDSSGNIYIADTGSAAIRKVTSAGAIETVAGVTGTAGSSSSSDHLAIHAELNEPFDAAY